MTNINTPEDFTLVRLPQNSNIELYDEEEQDTKIPEDEYGSIAYLYRLISSHSRFISILDRDNVVLARRIQNLESEIPLLRQELHRLREFRNRDDQTMRNFDFDMRRIRERLDAAHIPRLLEENDVSPLRGRFGPKPSRCCML